MNCIKIGTVFKDKVLGFDMKLVDVNFRLDNGNDLGTLLTFQYHDHSGLKDLQMKLTIDELKGMLLTKELE